MSARREVLLIRHGQTEWSLAGRHTGRTDIPLTDEGRRSAEALRARLAGREFALVLTSPLLRAADTCKLAGLGERAIARDELLEWDYGDYEGLTTPEVREHRPGWLLWRDGCPGGETAGEVGERVDRVIADLREAGGDAAVFAHGHVLRVLAARWLGLAPERGGSFALATAALSAIGYERELPVVNLWNDTSHLRASP